MTRAVGGKQPTTCVIVACYNQANTIELILAALESGIELPDEVILADDGSAPPISESLASRLSSERPFPVSSVWQEDGGFRKARIQNRAAAMTDKELLIFLDGDCIPFRNLVKTYRRAYREGEFMTGAVGYLGNDVSSALDPDSVRLGAHETALSWREYIRFWRKHATNVFYRGRRLRRPRIRGGNFAVCRRLFSRVDGFDQVYEGFGREDSDLRNRMRNAGALGISLWPWAIALHLALSHAPSGVREVCPDTLYREGSSMIRARRGMSSAV